MSVRWFMVSGTRLHSADTSWIACLPWQILSLLRGEPFDFWGGWRTLLHNISFSHWSFFLFTVKAVQDIFSQVFYPPPQKSNDPPLNMVNLYDLNQKQKLAKLCLKYKLEADSSKEFKHSDPKRKEFVANQQLFKSWPVREFFPSLKKAKSDSRKFKRALACHT